jgi:hypothetical protein
MKKVQPDCPSNLNKIFQNINSCFIGLNDMRKDPIVEAISTKVSKNIKLDQNFHKYFISKS